VCCFVVGNFLEVGVEFGREACCEEVVLCEVCEAFAVEFGFWGC